MLSTVIVPGLASASTHWWRRREPGPGIDRPTGRTRFLCSHRVQCWRLWARKQEKLWLALIALSPSSTHYLKTNIQLYMELPNETVKTAITKPLLLFGVGYTMGLRNILHTTKQWQKKFSDTALFKYQHHNVKSKSESNQIRQREFLKTTNAEKSASQRRRQLQSKEIQQIMIRIKKYCTWVRIRNYGHQFG